MSSDDVERKYTARQRVEFNLDRLSEPGRSGGLSAADTFRLRSGSVLAGQVHPYQGSDGATNGENQPDTPRKPPPFAATSGSWFARRVHGEDRPRPEISHQQTRPQAGS